MKNFKTQENEKGCVDAKFRRIKLSGGKKGLHNSKQDYQVSHPWLLPVKL